MIESLHSPHVARVKALIGSKGARERREQGLFVAEGVQCAREALTSESGPQLKILYATENGLSKISELDLDSVEIVEVSGECDDDESVGLTTSATDNAMTRIVYCFYDWVEDAETVVPISTSATTFDTFFKTICLC